MKRVTPEDIKVEDITNKDIFVFGSNENGIHGAGAARFAMDNFGARLWQGFGRSGNSFAIPTKDWDIITLDLQTIKFYVDRFIEYAEGLLKNEHLKEAKLFVTKIGCGLAGYTAEQIAPLFSKCIDMENVYLPQEFIDIINSKIEENVLNNTEIV